METMSLRKEYIVKTKKKFIFLAILIFFTIILFLISLCVGSSSLSFLDSFLAIFNNGKEVNINIIYNIRMPRSIGALLVGFGLAISGYIMQLLLKNPMASPSTLGVSNGAVFGANFAIILLNSGSISSTQGSSITISNPYLTTILAFIFALISIFIILLLSIRKSFSNETLILSGLAIGSLFTALTTTLQYFASDTQLSSAVFWSFGSLNFIDYKQDLIMFVVIIITFIYMIFNSWNHNSLLNGDDVAKSLGVNIKAIKIIGLLLASLVIATCVSFVGIIGFIGLIAPHIVKKVIGNDYRFSLPSIALSGSCLILIADIFSKIFINGVSLPIGAITAFFGVPLFLYLLLRKRGN